MTDTTVKVLDAAPTELASERSGAPERGPGRRRAAARRTHVALPTVLDAPPDVAPRWSSEWPARPLTWLLWMFPVWWALGASAGAWAVAAVVMAGWLLRTSHRLVLPPAFGWWLLFLCWVGLSALTLDSQGRAAAALYRGVSYLAGTIFLLYVLNTGERLLPTRVVARALTALWGWSVGLGLVALAVPRLAWHSVVERLLPASALHIAFVYALVHPHFATRDALVHVPRPTPLYQYTNSWGSVVGLLLPVAVWFALGARRRTAVALWVAIAVSAVPMVVSIDRGLWISVLVAVAYVLARRFVRGDLRAAVVFVAAAGGTATAVAGTGLGTVIEERLHASNTSTRQTLYEAAIAQVQKSPVLGYGSPTSSAGLFNSNSVSVGTHGQFWTVLVSQGIPGAVFFVGFFVAVIATTWRVSNRGLWLHAVLVVALVQLPFYDLLPAGIAIWGAVVALCIRDVQQRGHRPALRGPALGEPALPEPALRDPALRDPAMFSNPAQQDGVPR